MSQEQAMALNAVGAVNYSGISVPGDSIFDDIFDWISNTIYNTINVIGDNVVKVVNAIGDNQVKVILAIASGTSQVISSAAAGTDKVIKGAGVFFVTTINAIADGTSQVISSAAAGIDKVIKGAGVFFVTTINAIADGTSQVISSAAAGFSSVFTSIAAGTAQVITTTAAGLNSVMGGFAGMVSQISQTVVTTFSVISAQIQSSLTWFTDWLATSIPKIMSTWWAGFKALVFDFVTWVPQLLDAIGAWFNRDVPGHSPWWESILDKFIDFTLGTLTRVVGNIVSFVIKLLGPSLLNLLRPLGELFNTVVESFIEQITQFIEPLGPMDPSHGIANFHSLSKVGALALAALAGMTALGSWLKPLGEAGLGHIAAMIYDMTNYKLITGAFMTALTAAMLAKPLRYYYDWKFRPNLPSIRDLSDMYTDEHLSRAEFGQYLAYHGIADGWHDKFASIAWRSMSPYQLKNAAQDGSFDETIFMEELTNGGFRPETKRMLMDSFRKASLNNLRPTSVSSATYRYKNGFTDESQFLAELKILQVGDAMLPVYLASSRLDYASDYLTDLETAYTNAVRSGQIGIDDYRQELLKLGMVPQRVEGKVFIEQARVKPGAALGPVAGPKAYYLTDAGKLILDTTRRRRRKEQLTRDQEIAALLGIGVPDELATAYADNDEVRLKETATAPGG